MPRRVSAFFAVLLVLLPAGGCGRDESDDSPPAAAPAAPTGLTAAAGSGQVTLRWDAVPGATGYTLYMAAVPGVTKSNYAGLPEGARFPGVPRTVTRTGLANGTRYSFVVTASNGAGEGVESAEASAVPAGGGDVIRPTVVITSPTTAATLSTGLSPLLLGGTATDDADVVRVAWANAALEGSGGAAAGATFWSAQVPLAAGANVVTASAFDAAGNVGIASLTVTYAPAAGDDGKARWTYDAGHEVHVCPAVAADGTVYAASLDGVLHALYPDGTPRWAVAAGAGYASPAVGSDGTIYVGTTGSVLLALNPDGTQKWAAAVDGWISASPAVAPDDAVVLGTEAGTVTAVGPDGTVKWRLPAGVPIHSSPAIGPDGTVYVGVGSSLLAVHPDGTQKWSFAAGGAVDSSPAVGPDGTVYVGAGDRLLHAVTADGTPRWAFQTQGPVQSSPALGADGTVYVGSADGNLYAVQPNGTAKWTFKAGGPVHSAPALGADGTVYVGALDGKLYAVKPDGTKRWEYATKGAVANSPAIAADGTVYAGSDDHRLHAVGGTSGGLAAAPWPKFRRAARNAGNAPGPASSLLAAAGPVAGDLSALSLLVGLKAPAASPSRSAAGLQGDYRYVRFSYDGAAALHAAETGTVSFDGAGAAARAFTRNAGGAVAAGAAADTYAVAADGTLTLTSGGSAFAGAINADGSVFLAGGAASGTAGVQSVFVGFKAPTGAFSAAGLQGDYRYVRLVFGGAPAAALSTETGTIRFDGVGAATRTFTRNAGGAVTAATAADTYAVAADGILTLTSGGNAQAGTLTQDGGAFLAAGDVSGTAGEQSIVVGVKASTDVFSDYSLLGGYPVVLWGADGAGVRRAETGALRFDGIGGAVRAYTLNAGGAVTTGTDAPPYRVSTNGTLTLDLSGGSLQGAVR